MVKPSQTSILAPLFRGCFCAVLLVLPYFETAPKYRDRETLFSIFKLKNSVGNAISRSPLVKNNDLITATASLHEGLQRIEKNYRVGFRDSLNHVVISPQFEEAYSFHEGLSAAKSDGKWGYINPRGEWKIWARFEEARSFHQGLAIACSSGVCGILNHQGKWVGSPIFAQVHNYSEGFAAAQEGDGEEGLWGFLDTAGTWAIDPQFAAVLADFHQHRAITRLAATGSPACAIIDTNGGIVGDTVFTVLRPFKNGRAAMGSGRIGPEGFEGHWGFVDLEGRVAISPHYLSVSDFENGRILALAPNGEALELDSAGHPY